MTTDPKVQATLSSTWVLFRVKRSIAVFTHATGTKHLRLNFSCGWGPRPFPSEKYFVLHLFHTTYPSESVSYCCHIEPRARDRGASFRFLGTKSSYAFPLLYIFFFVFETLSFSHANFTIPRRIVSRRGDGCFALLTASTRRWKWESSFCNVSRTSVR